MMELPIFQNDAFADAPFQRKPAAVGPLDDWLTDEMLQSIAEENNLAETAFYVRRDGHYDLRWFAPAREVGLYGHATLAAAHVIFRSSASSSPTARVAYMERTIQTECQ